MANYAIVNQINHEKHWWQMMTKMWVMCNP